MLNITSIKEVNPMPTNFQMLKELRKTYGSQTHEHGVVTGEEIDTIKSTLRLAEMDILALRNLRDLTVAIWADRECSDDEQSSRRNKLLKECDECSAITHVIDMCIVDLGGEV